jgi:hypothetical protein
MKRKEKVIMEYPSAPSGYVFLNKFKEPFVPYSGGFGYRGVLLFEGKTKKLQCHECGEWINYLPHHLHKEHNMIAKDYKKRVGLRQSTALISEELRKQLIKCGLEARKKNLRPGTKPSEETKEKIRTTLKNVSDELQNEKGTCPLQVIERLYKLYVKLGRTPNQKEITFYDSIRKHYTFERACQLAGIPYRKPGQNINHNASKNNIKYTEADTIKLLRDLWEKEGKMPVTRDVPKGVWSAIDRRFGGWYPFLQKAMTGDGKFRCGNRRFKYSDEDLLQFLRTFQEEHKRVPRPSDARRGLLPSVSTYYNRFDSFVNARIKAGIIDNE